MASAPEPRIASERRGQPAAAGALEAGEVDDGRHVPAPGNEAQQIGGDRGAGQKVSRCRGAPPNEKRGAAMQLYGNSPSPTLRDTRAVRSRLRQRWVAGIAAAEPR